MPSQRLAPRVLTHPLACLLHITVRHVIITEIADIDVISDGGVTLLLQDATNRTSQTLIRPSLGRMRNIRRITIRDRTQRRSMRTLRQIGMRLLASQTILPERHRLQRLTRRHTINRLTFHQDTIGLLQLRHNPELGVHRLRNLRERVRPSLRKPLLQRRTQTLRTRDTHRVVTDTEVDTRLTDTAHLTGSIIQKRRTILVRRLHNIVRELARTTQIQRQRLTTRTTASHLRRLCGRTAHIRQRVHRNVASQTDSTVSPLTARLLSDRPVTVRRIGQPIRKPTTLFPRLVLIDQH